MNLEDLKKEISYLQPVFFLEKSISHATRRLFIKILGFLLLISFVISSGIIVEQESGAMSGFFFIVLSAFLIVFVMEAFYYSYRFDKKNSAYEFELASIIFSSNRKDLILNFIESYYGTLTLMRLGIDDASLEIFLDSRKKTVKPSDFVFSQKSSRAESFISGLISGEKEFQTFLSAHGITPETFWNTFRWVSDLEKNVIQKERWWSRARLNQLSPIGRDWAYGNAYALLKFSSPLDLSLEQGKDLYANEIKTLETVLSKSSEANALVIGEDGGGKMEIIKGLAQKIIHKKTSESLHDKKFLVLSVQTLLSSVSDGTSFERLFLKILREVIKSGNIILVIPDLPGLLYGAETLQSDAVAIMSEFLASPDIHIIAVSDGEGFHNHLERDQKLMEYFETIIIEDGDEGRVSDVLMEEVIALEEKEGIFFTYGAVKEAVQSASRYFVGSPLYDTASDLLIGAVAEARSVGRTTVMDKDIESLVKTKTGIPTGEITDTERNTLTRLEEFLHQRIVGQDEAVSLISDALRRARSGINNPNRPIGSFLFLGPTGVGKTETTKALAEIFFGKEAKILRLDMSEYNTPDALNRLIGGFGQDQQGVLVSLIRENPYGVLLLDEFEKTEKRVLDLFLQILDEGVFSDSRGKKISARNLIIIATSNAGSQFIFDAVGKGEDLLESKDFIINSIVSDGVFRPELLNRFDGVILFHPLSPAHLKEIAKMLLKKLEWRLRERGVTLEINDTLLDYLVEKGSDPKFGARPLNRAIQDKVEKIIADKIISGNLRPGSHIAFDKSQLYS